MLKKLLCLLLALMMVVSLVACDSDSGKEKDDDDDEEIIDEKDKDEGEDEDEDETEETTTAPELTLAEQILGTWVLEVELTGELLGMEDFETDVKLPVAVTFYDDGTMLMGWYEEGMEGAIDELEDDLIAYMCELMYTELEASGYSREQTDELFEQAYDMTMEEYCAEYVESMDLAASMASTQEEKDYELDGDVLLVDGEEIVIEIDGDTMTFVETNMEDGWATMGITFPAEWTRVA